MSYLHCVCLHSTPVLVLRVQDRLWPLLVPAWRNSAAHRSSSATAVEPATTTPTLTAFGWPPLKTTRCLRKTQTHSLESLDNLVFADLQRLNFLPLFAFIMFPPHRNMDVWCVFLYPFQQETCPSNAKSRQSPNTHKPLSGVHEEDLNLWPTPPALLPTTCLYFLFPKNGAISLHVWEEEQTCGSAEPPDVERCKLESTDQTAFCSTQNT